MRRAATFQILALVVGLASAAPAQDGAVTRQAFVYVSNDLTIEVLADAPGVLRVVRGDPGEVRVAGRARDGFVTSALAGRGRDRLELTALGAARVQYLVVVPEAVRVRVKLPDAHASQTFGRFDRQATYRWETVAPEVGGLGRPPAPPAAGTGGEARGFSLPTPPTTVVVPDLSAVRTLTVRWQGSEFRVETGRPLSVTPGDPEVLELRLSGPPRDLVVVLPRHTDTFVLKLADAPALVVADGHATVLCEPVMNQELDGGRYWITFTPDDGRLDCRGPGTKGRRSRRVGWAGAAPDAAFALEPSTYYGVIR